MEIISHSKITVMSEYKHFKAIILYQHHFIIFFDFITFSPCVAFITILVNEQFK